MNFEPGVLPLNWYNLSEFMCNKVSNCLGKEFARFDQSTTSRSPAYDLQMVTRVLSVTGLEQDYPGSRKYYGVDTNPSKGTMIAEFDCPSDAWFFKASSHDSFIPYSVLMEIGLQTSGILTSWVKAPLTMDRDNILFRNLDATATLLRDVDLRNKTIVNTSVCNGFSMLGKMGIHKFKCTLSVDGKPFYEIDTSFGWFVPEVFENQVGIDNGEKKRAWHLRLPSLPEGLKVYALPDDELALYACRNVPSDHNLKRRSGQAQFLDTLSLLPGGGEHSKGYAYGKKNVNKHDWFSHATSGVIPSCPGAWALNLCFKLLSTTVSAKAWPQRFQIRDSCTRQALRSGNIADSSHLRMK